MNETSIPSLDLQNKALIEHYFRLTPLQVKRFNSLGTLYTTWNERINLISRKDIKNLYLHHIIHSLSIAKIIEFQPQAQVLDVGTGGGLPGIPLAILFPKTQFKLIDATAKKIKAVESIVQDLGLDNVSTEHVRAEELKGSYDFIVCRAVSSLVNLYQWTKSYLKAESTHKLLNGLLCLKGGDLSLEIGQVKVGYHIYSLDKFFKEPFFATKSIVHLYNRPIC